MATDTEVLLGVAAEGVWGVNVNLFLYISEVCALIRDHEHATGCYSGGPTASRATGFIKK